MSYQVLARKWRPQQFDDVIGQQHVTRTLVNAIRADRVAHAYLFVGPRGVGKTSTARIFAKALNCGKGPTPTPCGECPSCTAIAAGASLDVIEIDAASNRGIDSIRDLRESVKYASAGGRFKVYIVDEVHMLTAEAFNALLKTLEEPPPHVKFVLATTEPQKVPATIASRCQRFDLRRISARDIVSHLGRIARTEGVELTDEALLAIARGAEGGLRDAESALDQLIAFRGAKIAEEDVLAVFGLVARQTLQEISAAILSGDVGALLAAVARLDETGKDFHRVMVELVEHFRNVLVCLALGGDGAALDVPELEARAVAEQAGGTDPGRVLRIVEILIDAERNLRHALSRRMHFEMALIRSARAATSVSIDQIIRQLNDLKGRLGREGPDDEGGAGGGRAPPDEPPRDPPSGGTRPRTAPAATAGEAPGGPSVVPADPAAGVRAHWPTIAGQIAGAVPALRSHVADAQIAVRPDGSLEIRLSAECAPHIRLLDAPHNRQAIRRCVGAYVSPDTEVRFVADVDRPPPRAPDAPAADASAKDPPARPPRRRDVAKLREQVAEEPLVKSVMERFGARISSLRE